MKTPYVVSADISLLLASWVKQRGLVLPSQDFFEQLRQEFCLYLSQIFPYLEFVPEGEMQAGLAGWIDTIGLPVISLDQEYSHGQAHLEITRLVNDQRESIGLGRRAQALPILQQIRKIQALGITEAVLVDDVIFSGELLERVLNVLARVGIRIPIVCAGIGIAEGVRRINGSRREVRCVRYYEAVIDEICERDFYPGVPLSGRLIKGGGNIGIPYILPFVGGKMKDWATISEIWQQSFSQFCLEQTIQLFKEIERCSGRVICCEDLERKVFGLPEDDTRYVDALCAIPA